MERRARTLAQAVCGSVGSQCTATNAPALRVGTDRSVLAIARAFSRWRSGLRSAHAINCITSLRPGSAFIDYPGPASFGKGTPRITDQKRYIMISGNIPITQKANVLLSRDFRYFCIEGKAQYKSKFPRIRRAVERLGRGARVRLNEELRLRWRIGYGEAQSARSWVSQRVGRRARLACEADHVEWCKP